MITKTEAVEIEVDPEYECGKCGDEVCFNDKCTNYKQCNEYIDPDDLYCDEGKHYCPECGETMTNKVIAAAAEKAKNAPIPGQIDMFAENIKIHCNVCGKEMEWKKDPNNAGLKACDECFKGLKKLEGK